MADEKKTFSIHTLWKVLLVILLVLLFVFVLIGLLGKLIAKGLEKASRKVDKQMSKLIVSKVVTNEKDFKRIAKYKSKMYFVKQAMVPTIALIGLLVFYIICMSINGWQASIFATFFKIIYPYEGTLKYVPPFGFSAEGLTVNPADMTYWFNIIAVIFVPLFLISFIWYLVTVSCEIAREMRINKLAQQMFSKNLDNVDLSSFINPTTTGFVQTPNNNQNINNIN